MHQTIASYHPILKKKSHLSGVLLKSFHLLNYSVSSTFLWFRKKNAILIFVLTYVKYFRKYCAIICNYAEVAIKKMINMKKVKLLKHYLIILLWQKGTIFGVAALRLFKKSSLDL